MKQSKILQYDRDAASDYAKEWALGRNSHFSISEEKGEGTNFVSQCIYAGAGIMNMCKEAGWYYRSSSDKTLSWTNPDRLYTFLINNKFAGPFAEEVSRREIVPGDIIQTGTRNRFNSSVFVADVCGDRIYICAHNNNTYMYNLSCLRYEKVRYLHILGVRQK